MSRKTIAPIARHIFPPFFKLWSREITGLEHLPKQGSFIIAPNHSSYFEHLLIGNIVIPYLNRPLHILAKKEHYDKQGEKLWHKYWGQWAKQIPIDRSKGDEALRIAENRLKDDAVLLMYPEGTRTLTGKIQKGKTGVARLAVWAQVPVVPLGITNMFHIMPKGKRLPRFARADFHFGKPMTFEKYYNNELTKENLRTITDKVMKEIARLSHQTYNF